MADLGVRHRPIRVSAMRRSRCPPSPEIRKIRPADLFCYLGARFGPPNGIHTMLRQEDSDNLIHWDWVFAHASGFLTVQGHNFRTEFHLSGDIAWHDDDRVKLIEQLKNDFSAWGKGMGEVRAKLESWVEFVNPHQRIQRTVNSLLADLEALELTRDIDDLEEAWDAKRMFDDPQALETWSRMAERYTRGFGLCFGIRSMLPVLAESFVNFLLYVLMKPELRSDDRLRDNIFRQPIDVRVKSLAHNCLGFATAPDYTTDVCKRYHSMVNERNDLLHGNVVIDKLKFNNVYFLGKMPVFREYRSQPRRALGVEMHAVGLQQLDDELRVVTEFRVYLMSCLVRELKDEVEHMAGQYELGINTATQRLGVLFPPWLVDFRAM